MWHMLGWLIGLLVCGVGLVEPAGRSLGADPYPFDLAFSRRTIERTERAAVRPDGRSVVYGVVTPTKNPEAWFTTPTGAPGFMVGCRLRVVDVALAGAYTTSTNDVWWGFEYFEKTQGRMGLPPWSDYRRYLENSPYYRADRIHTPLLIIHGQDDRACLVHQAEQMFGALKRLNRTAQLAVYQGQGHVIFDWDQPDATDATRRMLDFLDRHLKK